MTTNIKLIFSRSRRLGSRIIQLFTSGEWSHCGIVIDDSIVIDASFPRGVKATSLQKWSKKRETKTIEILTLDVVSAKGANDWLKSRLNKKYDLLFLCSVFNPWRTRRVAFDDINAYRCNELVFEYMYRAGFKMFNKRFMQNRSPEVTYCMSVIVSDYENKRGVR